MRLAARSQVLVRGAYAFKKGDGTLTENGSTFSKLSPYIALLMRIGRKVIDLRLIIRATQDQRMLACGYGKRHVIGYPARLGVYCGNDLTFR